VLTEPVAPARPGLLRQISREITAVVPGIARSLSSRGPQGAEFFCSICLNNETRENQAKLCCEHEFCRKCVEECK
jgi:hypothetical protein